MSAGKTEPQRRRPSLLRIRLRLRRLKTALGNVAEQVHALSEAIDDLSPLVEVLPYLDTTRGRPKVCFPLLRRHARYVREQEGLSRARLAALVGVSTATIRNFEVGRNRPVALTEARLLQVLADRAQPGRYDPVVVETLRLACELTATERMTGPAIGELQPIGGSSPRSPLSLTEAFAKGPFDDQSPQAYRPRPPLGTAYAAEAAPPGWTHPGGARRARRHRPRHPAHP